MGERLELQYLAGQDDPRWIVSAARLVAVCVLLGTPHWVLSAIRSYGAIQQGAMGATLARFLGEVALPAAWSLGMLIVAAGCLLLPAKPQLGLRLAVYGSLAWLTASLLAALMALIWPLREGEAVIGFFWSLATFLPMPALVICLVTRPVVWRLAKRLTEDNAPPAGAGTVSEDDPYWLVRASRLGGICILAGATYGVLLASQIIGSMRAGLWTSDLMGIEGWVRYIALPCAWSAAMVVAAAGCLLLGARPVLGRRLAAGASLTWMAIAAIFSLSGLVSGVMAGTRFPWETIQYFVAGTGWVVAMPALVLGLAMHPAVRRLTDRLAEQRALHRTRAQSS